MRCYNMRLKLSRDRQKEMYFLRKNVETTRYFSKIESGKQGICYLSLNMVKDDKLCEISGTVLRSFPGNTK